MISIGYSGAGCTDALNGVVRHFTDTFFHEAPEMRGATGIVPLATGFIHDWFRSAALCMHTGSTRSKSTSPSSKGKRSQRMTSLIDWKTYRRRLGGGRHLSPHVTCKKLMLIQHILD
jgi:hypothetical protein